jgi:outer membrane protein assembly factor BamB
VLALDASGSLLIVAPETTGPLIVLDARTGRQRWRSASWMTSLVLGDRVALLEYGRLTMADLATGRKLWSVAGEISAVYGDTHHLIAMDDQARATVRAVADGRALRGPRSVGIETATWDARYPDPFTAAAVIDGTFYVYGTSFVAAYRPTDLTRLWRTPVTRAPVSLRACGDAVCAQGPEGATVLDARGGAVRWTDARWRTAGPDGLLTGDGATAALVDPRRGRVVRDLGRAVPVGDLALRADGEHTWVVRLRDGRVAGRLPFFAPGDCVRRRPYLACPVGGRGFTVWRVDEPR